MHFYPSGRSSAINQVIRFSANKQTKTNQHNAASPSNAITPDKLLNAADLDQIAQTLRVAIENNLPSFVMETQWARKLYNTLLQRKLTLPGDEPARTAINNALSRKSMEFRTEWAKSMVMRLRPDWQHFPSISREKILQKIETDLGDLKQDAVPGKTSAVSTETLFYLLLCIKRELPDVEPLENQLLDQLATTNAKAINLSTHNLDMLVKRAQEALQITKVIVQAQHR